MEVIKIALIFLCVFGFSSGMVITKMGKVVGNDRDASTSTPTPEASNVRTKNPETDSVNDVAKPQLAEDLKEEELSDSPITKRCARSEVVGSSHHAPILSISRRDVSERRLQQCETCRAGKLCKDHSLCKHCELLCKDIDTTPSPVEPTPSPAVEATPPQEKREISPTLPPTTTTESFILGNRFGGNQEKFLPRYYSIGEVESAPLMRLFYKIFNVPEAFEKFVVLGKMKGATDVADFDRLMIIDLAQVFGRDKKTEVSLHRFENSDPGSLRLVSELNERIDEILREKMKSGNGQIGMEEINGVIDAAMKEVSNNVGGPHEDTARCNLDEAVDDLISVLPADMAERAKASLHHEQPHLPPQQQEVEESAEEIKNPPVIQDDFDVGARLGNQTNTGVAHVDDYVNDTEETKLKQDVDSRDDNEVGGGIRGTGVLENSGNMVGEAPASADQIKEQNVPRDLENNVLKIVEDSLRAVEPNILQQQNLGEATSKNTQQNLGEANAEDNRVRLEEPEEVTPPIAPIIQKTQEPEAPTEVVVPEDLTKQDSVPNVEMSQRSQFVSEKPNYFGSLVPTKDLTGISDPRIKKVLYVGDNMNLPLKMFQDSDGVIKLRVDTDALCKCKNTTCTKTHVDDRFRSAEETPELPPLQVRYGRELMDNYMDSLHNHDESLGIYKRSANVEVDEKMELENEIEKLTEDIEKYKKENRELLNKGTVALFKDVEKTKDVDQMITLANNFLVWMKELAMKHLN